MKTSLLILSGGMDSTTLLYDRRAEIGQAVSFFYGSKHNKMEIEHAKISCKKLNIPHKIIDLTGAFKGFNSALLDIQKEIPEGHYEDDTMKDTVVPFRNGIMLSVATGLAESLGLSRVLIATHAGDHAVYPDCREDFIFSMDQAILEGTNFKVHLEAPYTNITKEAIALIGDLLAMPWQDTYSCYKGGHTHCGRCSTCVERIWALRDLSDPTVYMDKEYAKDLLIKKGEWK